MKHINNLNCPRILFMTGLAVWVSLIVLNNITDHGTNIFLLTKMFTMEDIIADPMLGNGLEWRAITSALFVSFVLKAVIVFQLLNAVLLWRAVSFYVKLMLSDSAHSYDKAKKASNLSLTLTMVQWFLFMCGGLFYGYWMKMGAVQSVHMMLLLITLVGFVFVNLDVDYVFSYRND